MGKRKFKKPDDSESDYEWEEAKPNKQPNNCIKNSDNNELDGFINQYSTKSTNEMRLEKIHNEKQKQDQLYEDRIFKTSESSSNKSSYNVDPQWLKKSFNRILEQSESEGTNFMILLRDRYDEKTIDYMIKHFGKNYEKGFNKKQYERYENRDRTHTVERESICNEINMIVEERCVTITDINDASALLLKAELSGNSGKIAKLKKRIETLREAQRRNLKVRLTRQKKDDSKDDKQQTVMIQKTMKSGKMIPYIESMNKFVSQYRPYDNVDTNVADLLRQENGIDAEENDLAFARMSGKIREKFVNDDDIADCEYNDVFVQKKLNKDKIIKNEKQKAISSHKQHTARVKDCKLCYNKLSKHLVLSKGTYFCLIVPHDLGIIDFHCQLIPLDHIAACTHITDPDSWQELLQFKKQIIKFYSKELNSETIFTETVMHLNKFPHTIIDCIPLTRARETFQISTSVFFKKSMDEVKSEWCTNKKVLHLKDLDIRRTVPKEFSYFSVEFDLKSGFALIIENEQKFSKTFGLEVVGSILGKNMLEIIDCKSKSFKTQADAILKFEKKWKSYNLWLHNESSDESD